MQTEGVRAEPNNGIKSSRRHKRQAAFSMIQAAFFSQTAFFRGMSPVPLSLLCGGHPLFSWNEKRGEKNQEGRHLDTPSEIILQARLRMNFEGGQGSFFF